MRLRRLLVLLLAALALAACARQVPRYAAAPAAPVARSDLDAMMYGAPQYASQNSSKSRPMRCGARGRWCRCAARKPSPTAPTRSIPATSCASWCSARTRSATITLVDAEGSVSLPLIGAVPARGLTTAQLSGAIASRLKQSFIRDPSVAVEIETYRPFFVLGEVTYPGQYPYVPDMTVENAIAIAGGFTPRASKDRVIVTRRLPGGPVRYAMPLQYPLRPGDTISVSERWF